MRRAANALAVESDEATVISNELLEANVAAIRTDLTDLKATVREISAKAENELKTAVARIDEQFREVRQDIRELRADDKTLRDKIDGMHESLSAKIDGNYSSLDKKVDATHASLSAKIDGNSSSLDKKIDINVGELRADIKAMSSSISDLKAMQKATFWVLSSVSLVAAIVTIAKTLQWI